MENVEIHTVKFPSETRQRMQFSVSFWHSFHFIFFVLICFTWLMWIFLYRGNNIHTTHPCETKYYFVLLLHKEQNTHRVGSRHRRIHIYFMCSSYSKNDSMFNVHLIQHVNVIWRIVWSQAGCLWIIWVFFFSTDWI